MENKDKEKELEKDNNKEKIANTLSYVIMGIGLIIGLIIIGTGVYKNINNPKKLEANEARMSEITAEINNINAEQSKEFKENGFSKKYYDYMTQIETLQSEKNKLTTANFRLEHNSPLQYIVPGIFPIIFGFVIGMIVKNIINPPTPSKLLEDNLGVDLKEVGKALSEKMAAVDVEPEYKTLKCPNCGNNLDGEEKTKCKYCGATLEKVYKRKKKETK